MVDETFQLHQIWQPFFPDHEVVRSYVEKPKIFMFLVRLAFSHQSICLIKNFFEFREKQLELVANLNDLACVLMTFPMYLTAALNMILVKRITFQ